MRLGIADMEASLVPRQGNQMGLPDAEWERTSRLDRLIKVMGIIGESSFDFVDLGVGWFNGTSTALPLETVRRVAAEKGARIGSYTSFLPPDLRIVGPEIDSDALDHYLRGTLHHCHQLGGRVIGFGSGPSRQILGQYPRSQARRDLLSFLDRVVSINEENGYELTIAIEALDSSECNFVNTLGEAHEICLEAASSRIGLVLDLYHFGRQTNDYWSELEQAMEHVIHVQLAEPKTRRRPGYPPGGPHFDHRRLFDILRAHSYAGDVSVECIFHHLPDEIEPCYSFLKTLTEAQ